VTGTLLPDAPRPATIAAYYHPLGVRRSAPHNQRMQQTIPSANKFASGLAPDPRRLCPWPKQVKENRFAKIRYLWTTTNIGTAFGGNSDQTKGVVSWKLSLA